MSPDPMRPGAGEPHAAGVGRLAPREGPGLIVEGLSAGYRDAVVLESLDCRLEIGDSLAVLGRNGVGKTTFLRSLMGLTRIHAGRVCWRGEDLGRVAISERAARGIAWVPQERGIWPSLSVQEHLDAVARPGAWTVERAFTLFPRLAERRRLGGDRLSGGEQQMLAIARALVLNPRLLLLDEPMEGLAPLVVADLAAVIRALIVHGGMAFILVEQHAQLALSLTRRAVVLERGRVVHADTSEAMLADPRRFETFLSLD